MTAEPAASDPQPPAGIPDLIPMSVILDALRDAITFHRTTTRNHAVVKTYETVWHQLRAAPETHVTDVRVPYGDQGTVVLEVHPTICADGLSAAVLAGERCAACLKTFDIDGCLWQVLGLTPGGREIRICPDHRREDVLEPVS